MQTFETVKRLAPARNAPPGKRPGGEMSLSDIYAASFMVAKGCQVLRAEPGLGGRTEFVFAEGGAESSHLSYLNNGELGARDFVSALFTLKKLIHAEAER